MTLKTLASALAVLSLVAGSFTAPAQDISTLFQETEESTTGQNGCILTVEPDAKYWHLTLTGAHPASYAIMFVSDTEANWYLDMGPSIGAVTLQVVQPIDFLLGVSDAYGSLRVDIQKPVAIPPQIDGLVYYCQVVSALMTPIAQEPYLAFDLRPSTLSAFCMRAAQPAQ